MKVSKFLSTGVSMNEGGSGPLSRPFPVSQCHLSCLPTSVVESGLGELLRPLL